jgi:hypothetical protein
MRICQIVDTHVVYKSTTPPDIIPPEHVLPYPPLPLKCETLSSDRWRPKLAFTPDRRSDSVENER